MNLTVGIDLDNTVINFDRLIEKIAREKGYLGDKKIRGKKNIRDFLRSLPSGEEKWREIQKLIYDSRLAEAQLNTGVLSFIKKYSNLGKVYIISHKSPDLRQQAVNFLRQKGILSEKLISKDQFFTENSRQAKIERIRKLQITYFIDDLVEVFKEPSFPKKITGILFNMEGTNIKIRGLKVFSSFSAIDAFMAGKEAEKLSIKIKAGVRSFHRIKGGGNNRIYLLETTNGKLILKNYFREADSLNKRFFRELAALRLLNQSSFKNVPRLILADKSQQFIIYEYINGRKPSTDKINTGDIRQLVNFLKCLEKVKKERQIRNIENAAEACFSPADLINNLNLRLDRLLSVSERSGNFPELDLFLREEFLPLYDKIKKTVNKTETLKNKYRILSPSDFGFHNCLLDSRGKIYFLDFEHFGWDDPVKLISDFLLHPKMRLSKKNKELFLHKILKVYNDPNLKFRLPLYFPLYAMKWCLIFLNEFLESDFQRREFAQKVKSKRQEVLQNQLKKAEKMLKFIKLNYQKFPYEIDRT